MFGNGNGRNGNRLHGNLREWECKKPFPSISTSDTFDLGNIHSRHSCRIRAATGNVNSTRSSTRMVTPASSWAALFTTWHSTNYFTRQRNDLSLGGGSSSADFRKNIRGSSSQRLVSSSSPCFCSYWWLSALLSFSLLTVFTFLRSSLSPCFWRPIFRLSGGRTQEGWCVSHVHEARKCWLVTLRKRVGQSETSWSSPVLPWNNPTRSVMTATPPEATSNELIRTVASPRSLQ